MLVRVVPVGARCLPHAGFGTGVLAGEFGQHEAIREGPDIILRPLFGGILRRVNRPERTRIGRLPDRRQARVELLQQCLLALEAGAVGTLRPMQKGGIAVPGGGPLVQAVGLQQRLALLEEGIEIVLDGGSGDHRHAVHPR